MPAIIKIKCILCLYECLMQVHLFFLKEARKVDIFQKFNEGDGNSLKKIGFYSVRTNELT